MFNFLKHFVTKGLQTVETGLTTAQHTLRRALTYCGACKGAKQVTPRCIVSQTDTNSLPLAHDTFYHLIGIQKEINQLLALLTQRSPEALQCKPLRLERLALLEEQKFDVLWQNSNQNLQRLNHLSHVVAQAAGTPKEDNATPLML
jgi:hypothetical protein